MTAESTASNDNPPTDIPPNDSASTEGASTEGASGASQPPGEFAHLRDAYRDLRARTIGLCRSLTPEDAAALTPTCPAWSIKDVVAHMAGVCADILDQNTEGAATEAWADSHVEQRRGQSLDEVLEEWETRGAVLDEVIEHFASGFPPQFFLDAWTHEWDIRQALYVLHGTGHAVPDMRFVQEHLDWMEANQQGRFAEAGLEVVGVRGMTADGASPTLGLSDFEMLRLGMGRRSAAQADRVTIKRAGGVVEPAPAHGRAAVAWSLNDQDIVDPVSMPIADPAPSAPA